MYQEINNHKVEIFSVWKNPEFWKRWIQLDILENKKSIANKDDYYFTIILDLFSNMQMLNLDQNFAQKLLINSIGKSYIKNVNNY